ncbi:MAG: hypothetical protein ACYTFG_19850, partial [Planctomycetota bacterium]
MRSATLFVVTVFFLLLTPHTLGASYKGSWEKLRGKIKKLKTAEEIRSLPGEGRHLSGKGELFAELRDGFAYEAKPGLLKVSKKGTGVLDTTMKRDFQILAFGLEHPREKKCALSFAFLRKGDDWEIRAASFATFKSSMGELVVYDANANGRFDDVSTDIIQGPVPEEKPLASFLNLGNFRGLVHVWASGTRGGLWPVSKEVDDEAAWAIADLNVIRGRGGLGPVGLPVDLYKGLVKHGKYASRNGCKVTEEEISSLSGYTPEGHKAGKDCNGIHSAGDFDLRETMLDFTGTLTRVIDLFQPKLECVAICKLKGKEGEKNLCLANLKIGLARETSEIVYYPFRGQTNVPRSGKKSGQTESRLANVSEIGQPVVMIFPKSIKPKNVSALFK